jgi:hypothetical protein
MKNALVVLVFFIVIAAITWGIWAGHKSSSQVIASQAPSAPSNPPAQPVKPFTPPHPSPGFIASNDWQEFCNARDTTFRNNPDLAAEYKTLLTEMDKQQQEMEAAMIKADPKVAPLVVKLEAVRKSMSLPSGPVSAR